MQGLGCPDITEVEFDNMPLSVGAAMQYLIGEHNRVQEEHRPQTVYDALSKVRAKWKSNVAEGIPFFDEKGEVSALELQADLMKWCGISKWDNLKPRILTACCSELAWAHLEKLRRDWEEKQALEAIKKQSSGKKAGVKAKKVAFSYTSIFPIFSATMPKAVQVECLRALIEGEIGMKDITAYCREFQGKALIANTMTDHMRYEMNVLCDFMCGLQ
jgi:hypothetical protein